MKPSIHVSRTTSLFLAAVLFSIGCKRTSNDNVPSAPPTTTAEEVKQAIAQTRIVAEAPERRFKPLEQERPRIEINTIIDDQSPAPEESLTNPDLGLDSALEAAIEIMSPRRFPNLGAFTAPLKQKQSDLDREIEFNVEAPPIENDQIGLPDFRRLPNFGVFTEPFQGFSLEFAAPGIGVLTRLPNLGAFTAPIQQVEADLGTGIISGLDTGAFMSRGTLSLPGFSSRVGATKDKLLRSNGGNAETERAVAGGLAWLAKQQNINGYWEFDGNHKADRIAATGMCLLPFLAAGETHQSGKKYKDLVTKGLAYLRSQIKPNGQFGASGMYAHPIATIALCEAAGMTQDRTILFAAKSAVNFIVKAQGPNGSWGYTEGTDGDTSIVGWNIQALKSAQLAGLTVPATVFKRAAEFLNTVSKDNGATYGYRDPGATNTLTAVGLLCRQYFGWSARTQPMERGVTWLVEKYPPVKTDFNLYYYYYATQVLHFFDGPLWHEKWNPAMRKMLLELQITDKSPNARPAEIGSWPKDNHFIGAECGKVGSTAMAVLTLEVYYRHLPLYKRDNSGLQELER